jgi:type II secretory ATPase GspE/PulE/Tfp pilus assembly ATPase PilB-like protein
MPTFALSELLAQVPESTMYVHPVKLGAAAVCMILWMLYAQWVDKDTVAVNTYRMLWNLVSVASGIPALALLLLLPNFWAALAAFAVIQIAVGTIYVVHRNGLVQEDFRVCTLGHFRRMMQEGLGGKKKQPAEVRERVRLSGSDHRPVPVPDEEVEREQYRLVQDLMFDVLWRRASVVEIAPAGQASRIAYLIDGVLTERDPVGRPEGDSMVYYLKRIAGLSVDERRKPQNGRIMAAVGENRFEVAVRTNGSTAGEKLQLRVIGPEKGFKVRDLGFSEKQMEAVQAFMQADKGLVLFSAPRASGLTTTLYSLARSHDAFLLNIQMLEYTRELEIENITQKLHEPADDRTFAADLQRIVRSDPNVVVLPEIREKQAAVVASQAAAEKQKVYAGLPAGDVWDALKKWLALVGDARLVARGLLAFCHQRLVRVLCTACKTPYKPDPAMLRKLNLPGDKVLYRPPEPQYDKHGNLILCQACQGTGYVGRSGVFHLIPVDDGLRKVVAAGGSINDVQAYCLKQGVPGLQQQALLKVFDGVTSIDEVVRVTRSAAPGKPASPPAGGAAKQSAR